MSQPKPDSGSVSAWISTESLSQDHQQIRLAQYEELLGCLLPRKTEVRLANLLKRYQFKSHLRLLAHGPLHKYLRNLDYLTVGNGLGVVGSLDRFFSQVQMTEKLPGPDKGHKIPTPGVTSEKLHYTLNEDIKRVPALLFLVNGVTTSVTSTRQGHCPFAEDLEQLPTFALLSCLVPIPGKCGPLTTSLLPAQQLPIESLAPLALQLDYWVEVRIRRYQQF